MDYIIYSTTNKMRILDTTTDPLNLKDPAGPKPEQIKIEDPYFIPKSPIFHVSLAPVVPLTQSDFVEDRFNTGDLSRNLLVIIDSFGANSDVNLLSDIKLYIDHTSALFVQTLLSYIILYPEKFLALKNLDSNSRLIVVQDRIREKNTNISNAESEGITDFILLLIETMGSIPDEGKLMPLLSDQDKAGIHNWLKLNIETADIKKFTNTVDLFNRLSNSMKPDLVSGIPRELANEKTPNTTPAALFNDLVRVVIDVQFMEKILDIWKYLLESDNITPVIISFLRDELPKIFEYFEEAKPLPGVEEHVDISRVTVKNYLDTFSNQNMIARLRELSSMPSSYGALKIFRSLQVNSLDNFPDPNIINFLFTATFVLRENPALSLLHKRSEEFEEGWDDTTTPPTPKSPRHALSAKIFPGIIFKNGRAQFSESISLERNYNSLKNAITDLDIRIGQVGQMQHLLKTARGIPL